VAAELYDGRTAKTEVGVMSSTVGKPGTHDGPPLTAAQSEERYAVVDEAYDGYERDAGWLVLAGTMLGLAGVFSAIDGIVALSKSSFYVADARYVFGDLRTWGWIVLAVGVVEILASLAVLGRAQWARWFGIVVASLGALAQFAFMQSYPFWSLTILTLCILTVYGLAAHGGRAGLAQT
jgi:hypothetical protein